jgi:hypothetical protein
VLPATAIYYGKTCISASPGFGLQLIKEGILLPNLHAWMKTFYKKENESCTTVVFLPKKKLMSLYPVQQIL